MNREQQIFLEQIGARIRPLFEAIARGNVKSEFIIGVRSIDGQQVRLKLVAEVVDPGSNPLATHGQVRPEVRPQVRPQVQPQFRTEAGTDIHSEMSQQVHTQTGTTTAVEAPLPPMANAWADSLSSGSGHSSACHATAGSMATTVRKPPAPVSGRMGERVLPPRLPDGAARPLVQASTASRRRRR